MSQLSKSLKLFSSGIGLTSINGNTISIQTNLIRNSSGVPTPRFTSNSSPMHLSLVDRSVPSFYSIIDECRSYENYDLTENIMKLIVNNIVGLIDDDRHIVEVRSDLEDAAQKTDIIRMIFKRNDIGQLIKESIWPVIYYGSVSYLAAKDPKYKYKLFIADLDDPYTTIIRKREIEEYKLRHVEGRYVSYDNILYIGPGDFKLDTPEEDYEHIDDNRSSHHFGKDIRYSTTRYYGSRPLFYSVTSKIKDYLLKDILSSILSIKDAIQQEYFMLNMDISRNGSNTADFHEAANTIESLINRSYDESFSLGSILNIHNLVQRALSSVRVIPDPGGTLNGLDPLKIDELKGKLDRLRSGINDLKESILDAVGIPRDLYDGSTNSYESMQKNERLDACISRYLYAVKESIKVLTIKILNILAPELGLGVDDIKVTMFRKSPVEYARDGREMSALKDSLDLTIQILDTANQVLENNPFIDRVKYYEYVRSNLSNINKDLGELLLEKLPSKEQVELELESEY